MAASPALAARAKIDGVRISRTDRPTLPRLLLPPWAYPLVGIGATLVGMLPWFRAGLHLPLQNLWATPTLPEDMPLALVPLNQYYLDAILGLFVTAGVAGGLVARAAPPAHRALSGGLTAAGAFLAIAFACVQSALVLADGLVKEDDRTSTYLALVVAWAALSGLAGLLVLILLARAPRAGATVAVAIAAPAVGSWTQMLFAPTIGLASPAMQTTVGYLHWLPAVLVGVALGWCGVRTSGRIGAWVMSLALLWVVPAVLTVIGYMAGFRASGGVLESLGSGLDLFGLLLAPDIAGPPVLFALVIALVIAVSISIAVSIQARRADRLARAVVQEENTARDQE